jgi:D-alanyl-lipoteichoic acid acyltransferase DltB (MBOAT superfamily)
MKYIYIPLGGSRVSIFRRIVNVLVVFAFVGVWHDLDPRLLHWVVIICAFIVPDMLVRVLHAGGKDPFRLYDRPTLLKLLTVAAGER